MASGLVRYSVVRNNIDSVDLKLSYWESRKEQVQVQHLES
jgi:hypothetical protein